MIADKTIYKTGYEPLNVRVMRIEESFWKKDPKAYRGYNVASPSDKNKISVKLPICQFYRKILYNPKEQTAEQAAQEYCDMIKGQFEGCYFEYTLGKEFKIE
jgi:hypothetical protein